SVVMENLFGGIYKGKKVFISGNTGFKGSWLAFWLQKLGAKVTGYSLPAATSPSHFQILNAGYETITGDILDLNNLKSSIARVKPDIVFHLAAQSLVRESYRDPVKTYETNVIGTLNIFESAKASGSTSAIVNITTDKVYDNKGNSNAFREGDALGGHDMYSSSKACSEILTESYRRSFLDKSEMLLASARAGNVIGGGDWSNDRLIPDAIKAAHEKRRVVIRFPESVRPWQHVLEPLTGYLLLGEKLLQGKREFASAWNFGPQISDCIPVQDVLGKVSANWELVKWEIDKNENPHEAHLLILDSAMAHKELHWSPLWNLDQTVSKTVEWYREYYENNHLLTETQLYEYAGLLKK
ncbi:MAG: CDP-glucose 4,6-dehydratase, partial [Bacteroidota bacterium]